MKCAICTSVYAYSFMNRFLSFNNKMSSQRERREKLRYVRAVSPVYNVHPVEQNMAAEVPVMEASYSRYWQFLKRHIFRIISLLLFVAILTSHSELSTFILSVVDFSAPRVVHLLLQFLAVYVLVCLFTIYRQL